MTPEQNPVPESLDLRAMEEKILKGIAELEEKIIFDALTKWLGRKPTNDDLSKCQKRYRTIEDRINYHRYRLYYDFSFVGTVEHVTPNPITDENPNFTVTINFTPAP